MSVEERLERIERLVMLGSKDVLNVQEVALLIGVSESRVRHLCSERALPYYKQGRNVYFRKSEVEKYLLSERIPSNSEINSKAATYSKIGNF